MEIERFTALKRRSDMVRYDNHLYIGGQVASDLRGDIEEQTREVLAGIEQLLLSAGSSRKQVLSVRILLAHREDYAGLNKVWDAFFPEGQCPHTSLHPGGFDRPRLARGNDRGRRVRLIAS